MSEKTSGILGAGAQVVNPNWTGAPLTLAWHDSAAMPQTPNGSTVLAWQNTASLNNDGTLALTSGGSQPQFLDAPALANAPSILVQNFKANNIRLTNLSANQATPIWIEMFGPGLQGAPTPQTLTAGAPPITVNPGGIVTGQGTPNYMQLILTSNTSNLTIVTIVGGTVDASGNNAYVFALNWSGPPSPAGYTAVTGGNTYTFQFNWGSSSFYIANMSPSTAAPASMSLLSL